MRPGRVATRCYSCGVPTTRRGRGLAGLQALGTGSAKLYGWPQTYEPVCARPHVGKDAATRIEQEAPMSDELMTDGVEAIVAEARKTKETAERMANGDGPPGEADDIRVLAGMVHQVAEQVERLASVVSGRGEAPLADRDNIT